MREEACARAKADSNSEELMATFYQYKSYKEEFPIINEVLPDYNYLQSIIYTTDIYKVRGGGYVAIQCHPSGHWHPFDYIYPHFHANKAILEGEEIPEGKGFTLRFETFDEDACVYYVSKSNSATGIKHYFWTEEIDSVTQELIKADRYMRFN